VPTGIAIKVVDASALGALLFEEPEAERVLAALNSGLLVAPALLEFELANICVIKIRRHPSQRQFLRRALGLRKRMAIETAAVPTDDVVTLAETTGLTAYDASYLWLARRLNAELVTLDRKLGEAALRKNG
jgi:predicted nucleic acid-binding protein